MKYNILTHITPHVSRKEAACRCCYRTGNTRVVPFLPHVLEDLRQHVWHDQGYEIKLNIHRMASCLNHNRSLGKWYRDDKRISRIRVASLSGLDADKVFGILLRADKKSLKMLKDQFGIIWKPASYDGSRHVYIPDVKDACAVDFDMHPLTPAQLSDYIQIVMEKYHCNYAVLQYPKWNNPGVHFDVDTTRNAIVDKVA